MAIWNFAAKSVTYRRKWQPVGDATNLGKSEQNQHSERDTTGVSGALQINGLASELGHNPRGDLAPEMENPAAVGAAHGENGKAVQLASRIIADFTGEVHSADLIRDLILIALDATEFPDMTDRNRLEARAALAEALDLIKGAAQ
ncbi:hypothetical protein MASR1M32_16420 [Rhodobacter sp.]